MALVAWRASAASRAACAGCSRPRPSCSSSWPWPSGSLSSDAALTRSLHALLGITDPSRAPALQLGPGYRVAGFSLLGLQLALVLRGIAHAHAMFGDFARGEVLTSATARRLRGIALLITLFALCSPLVKMLLVLLFTWNAPGEPHMLIHIQLEDILLGLLGGLLFALAWAMEEAAHVAEENRGFI